MTRLGLVSTLLHLTKISVKLHMVSVIWLSKYLMFTSSFDNWVYVRVVLNGNHILTIQSSVRHLLTWFFEGHAVGQLALDPS